MHYRANSQNPMKVLYTKGMEIVHIISHPNVYIIVDSVEPSHYLHLPFHVYLLVLIIMLQEQLCIINDNGLKLYSKD